MSKRTTTNDDKISAAEEDEENSVELAASPNEENDENGSLFRMLSPELLLFIFQWIGPHDMKSYIRLATSGDQVLAHFIYEECTHL